jgi:hypothetical protein
MENEKKDTIEETDKKQETKTYAIPVPLLKQSDGKPSASFTMVFLTFNVSLLWFFLSIIEGIGPLKVRPFDAGQAMTFLTPLLGLYFGRRFTDLKSQSSNE